MKVIAKKFNWSCVELVEQFVMFKDNAPNKFISKAEQPEYGVALVAKWGYNSVNQDVTPEMLEGILKTLEEIGE